MKTAGGSRVLGIAGWKNSGKTTLTVRLVAEMTARGHSVSTVKHAHHDADVDSEGTDSMRHRRAGSSEVALVTGKRWALMHELRDDPEPSLSDILNRLSPVDLILVEGFKREPIPKIVVARAEQGNGDTLDVDPHAICLVKGEVAPSELPCFHLDDIAGIADFIEKTLGMNRQ